jgi:hypothetical protein
VAEPGKFPTAAKISPIVQVAVAAGKGYNRLSSITIAQISGFARTFRKREFILSLF